MVSPAEFATWALRAHAAMERHLRLRGCLYRRPGWLGRLGVAEHLWPVARALAATVDLAGVPAQLRPGFEVEAAIDRQLRGLERYWDARGPWPAYASDLCRAPWGGDRYYDDNAWVGLALVQLDRVQPGTAPAGRAAALFEFARSGWSTDAEAPWPGGTFWVEQGRGTGRRNHDRNTVSTAPNAELGLHLDELEGAGRRRADAERMYDWVHGALRTPEGLYFDRVRGDGRVDRALWSYNQGSMIGAAVLRLRGSGRREFLSAAEATARTALRRYAGRYLEQPPAFNAIFFRNLLLLHRATGDSELRGLIRGALGAYAEEAWSRRGDDDLLARADGPPSLLDQSALVSVLALAAWAPGDYERLA
ncbi:MAG TPA: glycoside hydrolase family 76 protein [Solirubrobacteraceae bacterium]